MQISVLTSYPDFSPCWDSRSSYPPGYEGPTPRVPRCRPHPHSCPNKDRIEKSRGNGERKKRVFQIDPGRAETEVQSRGECGRKPRAPPAGVRGGAGRVRGEAPAPDAAAAMPILVKAAACTGIPLGRRSRRSAPAFASGARGAVAPASPRPAGCAPNFGQRRPGSVPGTGQVRSKRRSCHREPGCLQPGAPGAKSGSESWMSAPL